MIEIAIGLVGFACGFVTMALFAYEALHRAGVMVDSLTLQLRDLRASEAKRIAHLRSIASSGGKAKAAKRKA